MKIQENLSKLISFKTISEDKQANKKALVWIRKNISKLPLHVKEHESNGYASLVITTRKTKKPKIFLAAHMDVVPAADHCFEAKIHRGKIYGRGVGDMKFAIACYLELLKDLKSLDKYDLGIMLTSDEEIGGLNGVSHLLSKGYSAEMVFLPDAGFNWALESEAKGVIGLEVTSRGIAAHAARPWEGDNALVKLMDFLEEVRALFPKEPCASKNRHYHDTLNISKIEGGTVMNQVANKAMAWLDIRHLARNKRSVITGRIDKIAKRYPGVLIKQLRFGNPVDSDPSRPEVKLFRDIVKKKYGISMPIALAHGASDARFFEHKGIPCIVTRPTGGGNHTNTEWISVKDLEKFYGAMREWVEVVAKID